MTRPLSHHCLTCRWPLERYMQTGQPDEWEHPTAVRRFAPGWTPHEPVPVPVAELIAAHVFCDICMVVSPTWEYGFADLWLPSQRGREDVGGMWLLCVDCAAEVDRRDVEGMLRRAEMPHLVRGEPTGHMREVLLPVYRHLLTHPWTRKQRSP